MDVCVREKGTEGERESVCLRERAREKESVCVRERASARE